MTTHALLVPAIFDLSTTHLIIIAVILLLLFGSRLPSIMRNLGGSVREFKKGMDTSSQPSQQTNYHAEPPAAGAPDASVPRATQTPPTAPPTSHKP